MRRNKLSRITGLFALTGGVSLRRRGVREAAGSAAQMIRPQHEPIALQLARARHCCPARSHKLGRIADAFAFAGSISLCRRPGLPSASLARYPIIRMGPTGPRAHRHQGNNQYFYSVHMDISFRYLPLAISIVAFITIDWQCNRGT
jgi:hypothetical protein